MNPSNRNRSRPLLATTLCFTLFLGGDGWGPPRPRDLVVRAPRSATLSIETGELAVLTLNLWGLPGWANGASSERYDTVREALERWSPDLVLLQEVWTSAARRALPRGEGWWVAESTHAPWPLARNGLVTLSRLPIVAGEFRAFSASSFPESLATKGALKTTVRTPEGDLVNVWNVHLQSGGVGIREKQVRELATWVRGARDGQVADLIGGDFNCTPDAADFGVLTRLGPSAHALSHTPYFPTYDGGSPEGGAALALDHVFLRPGKGALRPRGAPRAVFTEGGDGGRCSDHVGLWVDLELSRP